MRPTSDTVTPPGAVGVPDQSDLESREQAACQRARAHQGWDPARCGVKRLHAGAPEVPAWARRRCAAVVSDYGFEGRTGSTPEPSGQVRPLTRSVREGHGRALP